MDQKYVTTKRGNRALCKTTIGWKFKVKWKDGTESWIPLKVMKESNPIEIAEYAVTRGIADQPAFAWWVPYVLRKRDRIVAGVNSLVRKSSQVWN